MADYTRPVDIETLWMREIIAEFSHRPKSSHEMKTYRYRCPVCGCARVVFDNIPGKRWACPACHTDARRFVCD